MEQGKIDEKVKRMLDKEGVYIAGDTREPRATIILVSKKGKLYSTKIDQELDPERFFETLTVKGPFLAD